MKVFCSVIDETLWTWGAVSLEGVLKHPSVCEAGYVYFLTRFLIKLSRCHFREMNILGQREHQQNVVLPPVPLLPHSSSLPGNTPSCFCSPSDQWPSETGQTPWAPSWLWQLFYHDEQWAGIQQLYWLWRRWQHKQVGHCHSDWAVNAVCVFPSLLTILGFLKHADWPVGWFITSLSFFFKIFPFFLCCLWFERW